MKTLSSAFVNLASQKLILRYFNLPDFDCMSSSELSKFPELAYAFRLGLRFREEFSNSSVKVKKKFCCDFPMSDIYSEYRKSFKSFFK